MNLFFFPYISTKATCLPAPPLTHRQNVFAVLEDGEVHTYSHAELGPKQQELLDLYLGAGNPAEGIMDSGADTLLDSIRTRLESLLPPPEDQPQGSEGEGQETEGQEGEGQ